MVDEDSTLFYYCWSACSQPANYSQGSDSEPSQHQEQEQEKADDDSDFRLSKFLDKDKGVLRKPRVREGETPGLEEKEVILKENFGFSTASLWYKVGLRALNTYSGQVVALAVEDASLVLTVTTISNIEI